MATQAEVAEHLDLSQPSVAKLVSLGIFESAGRGALDRDACRVAYIRHLRGVASGRFTEGDLTTQRTRVAREQADKLSMANALRRGELIEVAPAVQIFCEQAAIVRTRLLALPSSIAPAVHRSKTTVQTCSIIEAGITEALEALCAESDAVHAAITKNAPTYNGDTIDEELLEDDNEGIKTRRRPGRGAGPKAGKHHTGSGQPGR